MRRRLRPRGGPARLWLWEGGFVPSDISLAVGDGALNTLLEALRGSRHRGENWFEAELVRRRGHLLQDRNPTAAETMFKEAIGIAQRQEAKLWELRAAVSLALLRHDQGRRAEAHALLAPVYGWFTEGFDTADLKEAKAL